MGLVAWLAPQIVCTVHILSPATCARRVTTLFSFQYASPVLHLVLHAMDKRRTVQPVTLISSYLITNASNVQL